jgi:enamine deaminase RidA (YjgF/YER057c/UK114 family)
VGDNDINLQSRGAFTRLADILKPAGGSLSNLVKITIFSTDMQRAAEIQQVEAEVFPTNPPAASLVQVAALAPPGCWSKSRALPCWIDQAAAARRWDVTFWQAGSFAHDARVTARAARGSDCGPASRPYGASGFGPGAVEVRPERERPGRAQESEGTYVLEPVPIR